MIKNNFKINGAKPTINSFKSWFGNGDIVVVSFNKVPKLYIKNNILYNSNTLVFRNCGCFELAEINYKKDIENSSSKQHEVKFKDIFEFNQNPSLIFLDQSETYEEFIEKFISHYSEEFLNNLINYNGDLIKVLLSNSDRYARH